MNPEAPADARGRFIVFEGIDGSGKSTQASRLVARLEREGREVVATREPYAGSPAGRRIREMASGDAPVSPETELAWFVEQRRDHVRDVVGPALARGAWVVCDRYYFSTVAYQGARGLDWEAILRDHEGGDFPAPDCVLWIDVAPDESLARVDRRGGTAEPVFEERAFLERVRDVYAAIDRPEFVRVDGAADADVVAERVAGALAAAG